MAEVFVGVEEQGGTKVYEARDYQESAFYTFMNTNNDAVTEIQFKYPHGINFKVMKFNTAGLQGNYPRFCVLVNERGEHHILSDDKAKLSAFVGWRNRIIMYGGNTKKSSNKKKSNKKTHKRK
jgi:hypothetical protein